MRLCGRVVACCISVLLVIICEVLVFYRHAGQEYARTKDGTVYTHIREQKMSGTASSENRAPLISQREKETEEHQQQR